MTKVNRVILADGQCHQIACAVLQDGISSPVVELLKLLEQGVWEDPLADKFPDEYQSSLRKRFLAQVEYLAEYGELEEKFNRLRDGIWEFKFTNLRITFFDTPGNGSYSAKYGKTYTDWRGKQVPDLPTDFDEFIRVGHYFAKTDESTSEHDIAFSLRVREEDLAHDYFEDA